MKSFIKEYAELNKNPELSSKVLILKEIGAYTLKHHTEGYEPAGSCARHTVEKYSVTRYFDGAIHGRSFLTLSEAEANLVKVTKG